MDRQQMMCSSIGVVGAGVVSSNWQDASLPKYHLYGRVNEDNECYGIMFYTGEGRVVVTHEAAVSISDLFLWPEFAKYFPNGFIFKVTPDEEVANLVNTEEFWNMNEDEQDAFIAKIVRDKNLVA